MVTTGTREPSPALIDEIARRAGIRLRPTLVERLLIALRRRWSRPD
ncbi:MAG: hypothetical protein QOF76_683 [Solirubrobacteraceae bacterium]|jgi:hypothetical protein|nr:hypothetical protein [Solirubrobacteraceae bacterium]